MRVSYYCSSCNKKNYFKTKALSRFELVQEIGSDELSRRCDYCGTLEKKYVNRISAEAPRYMFWLCALLTIGLTVAVYLVGFIAMLTFSAPLWLYTESKKKSNRFNKTVLKRSLNI